MWFELWARVRAWLLRGAEPRGNAMAEYGVLLFCVAFVALFALMLLGSTVAGIFDTLASALLGG